MAKQKIKPIEKVSQITPEYIKQSIAAHYPADVASKTTDLFAKTMAYDYKQKAKNLKWLFGDDTSITLDADPDKVLASLKKNNAYGVKEILSFLESVGATYTAKQLSEKKCTYQKQEMRISRVIDLAIKDVSVISSIIAKNKFEVSTIKRLETEGVFGYGISERGYNKRTDISGNYNGDTMHTDGQQVWIKNSEGFYESFATDSFSIRVRGGIRDTDIDRALNQIQAGSVIMSMDLNDFITCSSGGVQSCMSFGSSYHNGWMNHFRSDFGLMIFLKNPDDRFHKLGRQWLFVRFTKDGIVFDSPAMKFQRAYGKITTQHDQMVTDFIFEKAKAAFGDAFDLKNFDKITEGGLSPKETSLNVSGSPRAGYLDTTFGEKGTGYGMKQDKLFKGQRVPFPNYQSCGYTSSGATLIFDFPDALAIDGHPSHNGGFQGNTRSRRDNLLGVKKPYKIVKCSITDKEVLDAECTFVPNANGSSGDYITTELLIKAFNPELIPEEEESIVEVPEEVPEEVIVISDEEIEDF